LATTVPTVALAAGAMGHSTAGHPMGHRATALRTAPHRHFFALRHGTNQLGYSYGYFGDDLGYEQAPAAAPTAVIVGEPSPPAYPVRVTSERDEHATVETTPEGVTIVRGPGSHHIAP